MSKVKSLSLILGLVLSMAAILPLSLKVHRSLAGTPALEQRIEEVAARLDGKIDSDRMKDLQSRMWTIERRWGEVFLAEKNYAHRTISELLQFMPEETATHYRELEAEYRELEERNRTKKDHAE